MCDNKENARITEELKSLFGQMWCKKFFFYLFRNNPRSCNYFYTSFIIIIGADKWSEINPTVRVAWESARNSFDRMYGLLNVYKKYPEKIAEAPKCQSDSHYKCRLCTIDNKLDDMNKVILKVLDPFLGDDGTITKRLERIENAYNNQAANEDGQKSDDADNTVSIQISVSRQTDSEKE